METKVCRACGDELPLTTEYFYSNGYHPSGKKKWKPTCKLCENGERKDSYYAMINEVFPKLECQICGYSKCKAALEFHHLDPAEKEYSVSTFKSSRRNKEVVLAELKKCVLLCSNCHREIHAGITVLGE
ncbi:HNH endonuclease [Salmonella phage NR01]|uniref:HNH endonuclease n=2 Tax=Tequintavirus TaxID=187218 RepID=A0A7D3V3Z3_9CAUD|nr:HNH endonuclease [Salmonella phage NR01]AKN44340.1 putative HNH nuclease domain-containing protein [Salmonella phage NR01]QKE54209.1 HNH endonuclease [Salmonella phage vB_SalS_SA001]